MPSNIVKSFAQKTGKSEKEVDDLWNKAKEIAKDEGHEEEYDYITGILKKMLKINESQTFKDFINESKQVDYNGIYVEGDTLNIRIVKSDNNNLMRLEFSGDKTLTKLPSAESLKSEYNSSDWGKIEKIWSGMAKKKSSDVEKLVFKFEKELKKIIDSMEKDLSEL